jgi:hypothetical protein
MQWTNRFLNSYRDRPQYLREPERAEMDSIQGTIQRVDYQRRELRVIAQGRAWRFVVADDCRLSFNDTPAILRCFHPLDPVTVIFRGEDTENVAVAMYSAERKQPC